MTFKIEKNIPMPDHFGIGAGCKYPWNKMEVGDSIIAPNLGAARSGQQYGKRHGMKFSARKLSDGSYRTWRIE